MPTFPYPKRKTLPFDEVLRFVNGNRNVREAILAKERVRFLTEPDFQSLFLSREEVVFQLDLLTENQIDMIYNDDDEVLSCIDPCFWDDLDECF